MGEAVLRCPNCGARMVGLLRDGILVRECGICGGVFLGRVDFERLVSRRVAVAYEGRHRRG